MARYAGAAGVRFEELGEVWAAYSPASGETNLINAESAVLLEWLLSFGPADAAQAAAGLASDVGIAVSVLESRLQLGLDPLLSAGLIQAVGDEGYPRDP